ncbi:MAG TPA: FAD-dependent oxidoreductase [Methylomirabilota bacterium]|nr:FAD-dependent oxidoreductase [Methylomirabilota bacterium]
MAPPLLPSALDAATQTFPVLTDVQIGRIRPFGKLRAVKQGEILFQPGDTGVSFFVVLSGGMEIVQPRLSDERRITTHGPAHFTGELTMISGQRCLVLGRVTEPGEFLELPPDALRSLIARDAELSDILMRAFILRRLALINQGYGSIILLGSQHSAHTLRLREFLTRNGHPFVYLDLDTDRDVQELLDRFAVKLSEIPVVICNFRHTVLRNPSIRELADCIGLNAAVDGSHRRDLIVVGAGPSGLAAAVYAASEGLDVLVIERDSPGGQAAASSKIENYLGFPMGVSGQELAARAFTQAEKFGAKLLVARRVVRLDCAARPYHVVLENGETLPTRAVIIATGAQYNKPRLSNLDKFRGQGVYYGATHIEAQLCGQDAVAVIGGGNSAGQAAVYLSSSDRRTHMLVRSSRLSDTMSRYLIQRIEENPAIEVHYNTEIVALEGDAHLESVVWQDKSTGQTSTHDLRHIFVMAGASPRTEWLQGCVALDNKGFILTGRDLDAALLDSRWTLSRPPQMLETNLPGVFAVGDVRAGNVKRVASAVGEGAIAVHLVHRALADL